MKKTHIDIILILSTIILLILFVFILFTAILGKDIDPPNVDDLKVTRLELDDDDNAFTYLAQATNITWGDDDFYEIDNYITNDELIVDEVSQIIASNNVSIRLIDRALKCRHLQVPEMNGFNTLIPYVSKFREQARLKSLQARLLFSQGKENEAFETAIDIVKFGEMQKNSGGALIHYLVAIAVEGIGLNTLEYFIPLTTLKPETLIGFIATLEKNSFGTNGFSNSMKVEYRGLCITIDEIMTGKITPSSLYFLPDKLDFMVSSKSFFFLPDSTKKDLADDIRLIIKFSKNPYNKIDLTRFEIYNELSISNVLFNRNFIGKSLRKSLFSIFYSLIERLHRYKLYKEAIRILLALKAYQIDNGTLPKTLNELVPHYINKVPQDPYDGKSIRYNREKKIIYSIGKNLKDEGGSDIQTDSYLKNRWTAEDIVFAINPQITHILKK